MQLTYEIANLRLLLEGSLSDRLLKSNTIRMVKPRTTVGFTVTLTPRYKDAVAVVEVEVEKIADLGDGEPPVITALLPREKTYNVASIKESSISVGAGAVTQVFGIAGSFLHGSKSYYLVQDQDTLALPVAIDKEERLKKTVFLWQFRPVLGQRYVSAAMKQTFVQVAFPSPWTDASFGKVLVTTYWCHYDRKTGRVGNVISGSLEKWPAAVEIPNLKLELPPKGLAFTDLEDLGNSQMLVRLHGRFLTDTVVRIGSTFLTTSSGLSFTQDGMEFVASISDLATKRVRLVARDGSEIPLEIRHKSAGDTTKDQCPPSIKDVTVSTVDETNSLVTVTFKDPVYLTDNLVFLIGTKVFGYRDAAFLPSDGAALRAIVPTALIAANPTLIVKPLFAPAFSSPDKAYEARRDFGLTLYGQPERIVPLETGADNSTYLMYGSRLGGAKVLSPEVQFNVDPAGASLKCPTLAAETQNTLRCLNLTAAQIKAHKQILLQRGPERPIFVSLPSADSSGSGSTTPGAAQQISVNATVGVQRDNPMDALEQAPAMVNADNVVFVGNGLKDLKTVMFGEKSISFELAKDGKSVQLKNLKANQVTGTAGVQLLQFIYKAAVVPVKLDVVGK